MSEFSRKLAALVERDGPGCRRCGQLIALTVDHIVPRSAGGSDALVNLQVLCKRCNSAKGSRIEPGSVTLERLRLRAMAWPRVLKPERAKIRIKRELKAARKRMLRERGASVLGAVEVAKISDEVRHIGCGPSAPTESVLPGAALKEDA